MENIDYDLSACLEYNPQEGFTQEDIVRVRAVWEGENDGDDWRWVLELKDGRYAFLEGGCDYTGWDCQSWASGTIGSTLAEALVGFDELPERVKMSLGTQLLDGVLATTWRDRMKEEFGF